MASYEKRTWWTAHGLTDRVADESFLEAAIIGAFLIAAADGRASELEYDALLNRLELLGGVERDTIDEHLSSVARELEASSGDIASQLERISELVQDPAGGHGMLMLSLAVAVADDQVTDDERAVAAQIAKAVGLDGVDLDPMLSVLRD